MLRVVRAGDRIISLTMPTRKVGVRRLSSTSSSSSSSSDASDPTAGRAANSTAAPPEHPPPSPPRKHALARAAREGHGHPIYCVSFSRHVHASSSSSSSDDDDDEIKGGRDDGGGGTVAVFATCGGPYATIYEVAAASPSSSSTMNARQVYRDVDDGEIFYTCAFGGRGAGSPMGYSPVGGVVDGGGRDEDHDATTNGIVRFGDDSDDAARRSRRQRRGEEGGGRGDSKRRRIGEDDDDRSPSSSSSATRFLLPYLETQDGPPLLCLGGTRGTIKVIDTVRRGLFLTLSGHGNDVTDLKFSPSDEWLLLSSSKDESVRLWNLRRGVNIAVFAGHNGHRGQVLSVSWHLGGAKFATSGMDNMVKLWKVYDGDGDGDGDESDRRKAGGPVETALRKSEAIAPDDWSESGRRSNKFDTLFHQFPYFSTNRAHTDYVGERVHS